MDFSILLKSPLFSGMYEEEIKSIFKTTHYRIKSYSPGEIVSISGDPVNSFLMVIEGVVKGEMMDFTGRVIKIEDIHAPGALASAFLFGKNNSFPVTVTAVDHTAVIIIDKADFVLLLRKNEKVLLNFLDMISNRSQFLSEKIKFLNFRTIKGKLAQFFLQKAGQKSEFILDITQTDLADFFGVARPSIARVIREMEEMGLVIIKGKSVKILNWKGLTELVSD